MEYSEVKNVISANANPNHLKKIRIDSSSHWAEDILMNHHFVKEKFVSPGFRPGSQQ
jgi:hypothetical protein